MCTDRSTNGWVIAHAWLGNRLLTDAAAVSHNCSDRAWVWRQPPHDSSVAWKNDRIAECGAPSKKSSIASSPLHDSIPPTTHPHPKPFFWLTIARDTDPMPPKAALKRGCRVGKRATVPLEDISVNEDSGWRDVDEAEVDKFYQIILDGDYGNTTLKAPTVRAVNKDVVPDSDRNPQGRSASQFVLKPPKLGLF